MCKIDEQGFGGLEGAQRNTRVVKSRASSIVSWYWSAASLFPPFDALGIRITDNGVYDSRRVLPLAFDHRS